MSSEVIIVGYGDSPSCKRALDFAVSTAKHSGGEIHLAYVIEWSPYSFLTPEQLDERHKQRELEMKSAQNALDPIVEQTCAEGVTCTAEIKYGHIAESLLAIAKAKNAKQIVVGRTKGSHLSTRLFGSVPTALVQVAKIPVTVVP